MDTEPFSPREFLKARRPEQFSDTEVDDTPVLDRSTLEYNLETLTSRGEEKLFEDFARRLAEREIAPNLLPQTGPTGGGDSKVDSETYPVAELAEYAAQEGDAKHLSVVQHGWKFDTPGNRWLALNPAIARALGWTLSSAGLFRWVDANESLMVESIWWEDGFVEHEPPHFDDEVGSGWAVRATKAGWEQIEHLYGTRTTCVRVRREAKDQPPRETISLFAESNGEEGEA